MPPPAAFRLALPGLIGRFMAASITSPAGSGGPLIAKLAIRPPSMPRSSPTFPAKAPRKDHPERVQEDQHGSDKSRPELARLDHPLPPPRPGSTAMPTRYITTMTTRAAADSMSILNPGMNWPMISTAR